MTHRQAIGRLVLVALVWGGSFALTKQALTAVSPLLLMGIRFLIATAAIAGAFRGLHRAELRAGLILGMLFWGGFVFQTIGLQLTTPSRSAFITSLSAILTPALTVAIHRTTPGRVTIGAIVVATAGIYLLAAPEAGSINVGDVLTLGCALLFTGQIVAVSHYTKQFAPIRLLAMELGLTAALSFAAAPFLEAPRFTPTPAIVLVLLALALTGLWSFHMQLRAQQHIEPAEAALVFMLEPVFATVVSFLAFGERLTPLQLVGGTLILAAMALQPINALRRTRRVAHYSIGHRRRVQDVGVSREEPR